VKQVATIIPYDAKTPRIASDVFIAPNAVIIGDVEIGPGSSVWFGAVLRGDIGPIRIGRRTNLQDGVLVHLDHDAPTTIGDDVTIGHGAIVHGTTVGDGVQVGMGAVLLSRSRIGAGSLIAAGAVVLEDARVPDGSVALGVPARVRRDTTPEERSELIERAHVYAHRGANYRALLRSGDEG
jgi:carbonic anhydrase/acetyltransferase-like protein (isoleucine patch superfamily)